MICLLHVQSLVIACFVSAFSRRRFSFHYPQLAENVPLFLCHCESGARAFVVLQIPRAAHNGEKNNRDEKERERQTGISNGVGK
jgi:hypothetical protein